MIGIWLITAGICCLFCAWARAYFILDDFNPTLFYIIGTVLFGFGLLFGGLDILEVVYAGGIPNGSWSELNESELLYNGL